jgi:hypothetical protein
MESLGDLLSLKGLIAISISSLIGIKCLTINFHLRGDTLHIRGDNNVVAIIRQSLRPGHGLYVSLPIRCLIGLMALLCAASAGFASLLDTTVLAWAVILPFISLVGTVSALRAGEGKLGNLLAYLLATLAISWIVIANYPLTTYVATNAPTIPSAWTALRYGGLNPLADANGLQARLLDVCGPLFAAFGLAALVVLQLKAGLAFLAAHDEEFEDAFRFALLGTVGSFGLVLLAGGGFVHLIPPDLDWGADALSRTVPFVSWPWAA